MAAFRRALELGADGIEFDVHATSDGGLVVFHDELLHRTSSGTGSPCDHELRYVRSLDAGSWFDPRYEGEQVPLLEEVLGLPTEFELELKASGTSTASKVVDTVRECDAFSRTEFTSWNVPMLLWLKERWPDARVGLFSMPRWEWMTDEVYERSVLAPVPFGAFDVVHAYARDVTPHLVEEVHRLGMEAHANDAGDAASLRNALAAGADRLSANDVALARSIIDAMPRAESVGQLGS